MTEDSILCLIAGPCFFIRISKYHSLKYKGQGYKYATSTACLRRKYWYIKLLQSSKKRRILVIADAAALGSEIKGLLYFRASTDKMIDFFLPESFEWLILRSAIFDRDADVRQKLADPVEYIDCKEYFSWERFFTALLVSASKGKPNLEYPSHKGSIPSGYLTEANIDSILNAMNRGKQ